jgi:GrpB-like predicted nucleotidyltransferase (UPF0157 family)
MSDAPDAAETVVVVEYDSAWPGLYEKESACIRAALGDAVVAVEHIGSTAVPGLAAKPVLDVLAGLQTLDLTRAQIEAMASLGYEYLGEYGIPGRLFFRKGRPRSHHVHAVLHGSDLWERHLAFRDYLRAHPDEAGSYAAFKRRLAVEVAGDRERYTAGKEAVTAAIQARALTWRTSRVA